ncbi:MAG TPA: RICIN domain-containing protein [Candidatus Limnocylindrales bacterium]
MNRLRNSLAALLMCVATSALAVVAAPSPASAAPYANGPMPLINVGSNKCFQPVEPSGHVEWAGVPVLQRTCFLSFTLQNWRFESKGYVAFNDQPWWCWGCIPDGAEGYFIRNQQTDLCLDARDGATTDWSVVQQWTCRDRNARSMVWYVQPGDYPDSFKIRNFNSDLCLDVAWGSPDDFAQIQQYHCTGNNPAQNFYQALWPLGT